MRNNDKMPRCAICDEAIPQGWPHFQATITPQAAAKLIEADRAELAPAWVQLADGQVLLSFCTTCAGELMDVSQLVPVVG